MDVLFLDPESHPIGNRFSIIKAVVECTPPHLSPHTHTLPTTCALLFLSLALSLYFGEVAVRLSRAMRFWESICNFNFVEIRSLKEMTDKVEELQAANLVGLLFGAGSFCR